MAALSSEPAKNGVSSEKNLVALSSVLAAIFLTSMKIIVGLITGSLGILSEAAHSGLDLIAALVTFFAVRVSDKPADRTHQFGHGKVENLSALVETLLLLITCIWIIYEAIKRLFFKEVLVEASIWGFIVMGVSIIIDVTRSRALMRIAKAHNSQALEADALHFSTDVWSSSVVIAGLALVRLGDVIKLPWLAKADAVAALVVAMIVVYVSIQLGKRAVHVLLDAAPDGVSEQVEECVRCIPGVQEVRLLRLRQAGPQTFAEVVIAAPVGLSILEGHRVAGDVEAAVQELLPGADVVVHVEASMPDHGDLLARVRALAAQHRVRVHGLSLHDVGGRLTMNLHVEVDDMLTLQQAHDQVTAFEADVRHGLDGSLEIVSHIEPICAQLVAAQAHSTKNESQMRAVIAGVMADVFGAGAAHDLHVIIDENGLRNITVHVHLSGETGIAEAHALTEQAERSLRQCLPELGRIVIHLEPAEHCA